MPSITIYVRVDQYDKIRKAPSRIIQKALDEHFKKEGGKK